MSTRIPAQRLRQSAFAALHPRSTQWTPSRPLPILSRRNYADSAKPEEEAKSSQKAQKDNDDLENPLVEQILRRQEMAAGGEGAKKKTPPAPRLRQGKAATSSSPLFRQTKPQPPPGLSRAELAEFKKQERTRKVEAARINEAALTDMTLDPDPRARIRLERRMVIASLKKHGRLSKAQSIARKERQSLFKSQNLPTSTKKLQKIANQMAGKTVSEALVQLRFSKKKVARDVIKALEMAQNEAIVGRGMGLGSGLLAKKRWEMQRAGTDVGYPTDLTLSEEEARKAAKADQKLPAAKKIELKDGTRKIVRDPTEIYIDQAWVGKGETYKSVEYRARGKINLLRNRTTSFSVLLKEEKTRIRISREIQKKRDNRKLWVQLPDRPVTAQRQYCLW